MTRPPRDVAASVRGRLRDAARAARRPSVVLRSAKGPPRWAAGLLTQPSSRFLVRLHSQHAWLNVEIVR